MLEVNQKFFTLFYLRIEIIQDFINLFDHCEKSSNIAKILNLTEEIKLKLENNFSDSPIIEKLTDWIEGLEKINQKNVNISEKLCIEIESKILEWLSELSQDSSNYLKIYEQTFSEKKTEIQQFYNLIGEKNSLITSFEKKYAKQILQYLMIIDKNSGVSIYEYNFKESIFNPQLLSGFITAIQCFGSEISKEETPITKLAYKNFEIILDEKEKVSGALILKGNPTDDIIKNLKSFVTEFESKFKKELENWNKDASYFNIADVLINKIFF